MITRWAAERFSSITSPLALMVALVLLSCACSKTAPAAVVEGDGGSGGGGEPAPQLPPPRPRVAHRRLPAELVGILQASTPYVSTEEASGSGIFVDATADAVYVLTNAHVVGGAAVVDVTFDAGSPVAAPKPASVVATDVVNDLALVRMAASDVRALAIAPVVAAETAPTKGSPAFVVGYPFGDALAISERTLDLNITSGVVAHVVGEDPDAPGWLDLDVGIHPGNSGGPVLDDRGRLLGVTVAKIVGTMRGFAIPIQTVRPFLAAHGVTLKTEAGGQAPVVAAVVAPPTPKGAVLVHGAAGPRWGVSVKGPGEVRRALVVVANDVGNDVTVEVSGHRSPARVVRRVEGLALTLLEVEDATSIPPATIALSRVLPTSPLFAIRNDPAATAAAPTILDEVAVTSARHGDNYDPRLIQLDVGAVDVATPYGPLYDAEGQVRGLVVAGLPGSEIVMAVPSLAIADMLKPSIIDFAFRVREEKGECIVGAVARLDDPLGLVTSVALSANRGGATIYAGTARIVPPIGIVLSRKAPSQGRVSLTGAQPCTPTIDMQLRLTTAEGVRNLEPRAADLGGDLIGAGPDQPYPDENAQNLLRRALDDADWQGVLVCNEHPSQCSASCKSEGRVYDCLIEAKSLVDLDPARGNAAFEAACDEGFGEACGELGFSFAIGRGKAVDVNRAKELWLSSCRRGWTVICLDAAAWLWARDRASAKTFLKHACNQKNAGACAGKKPTLRWRAPGSCGDTHPVLCARDASDLMEQGPAGLELAFKLFVETCSKGVARSCGMAGLARMRLGDPNYQDVMRKYCPKDPTFGACKKYLKKSSR